MKIARLEGLKESLSLRKNIVVTVHVNPDGDAVGSMLGLIHVLNEVGHSCVGIIPNDCPMFLKWLPGFQDYVVNAELQRSLAEEKIKEADVIFHLDYNAISRAANLEEILKSSAAKKVMIDHHQQPEEWPDYVFSDTSMSSTCQMIYEWLDFNGWLGFVTYNAAICLYTGILTDTGSFRFNNTTARTHKIAAHFLEMGVRPDYVYNQIFDSNTIDRMQLLGVMLKQMIVLPAKKAVILYLNTGQLYKNNYQKGDSEGFVNYGLSINGVAISAFLREDKENVKVSLRSKGEVDVNVLAREFFNGGGHKNAAGGTLFMPMNDALSFTRQVLQDLETKLSQ